MLDSFSLFTRIQNGELYLSNYQSDWYLKCYHEPMDFYIFNVFKSITVIIPLDVQIVLFLASGSSSKFAPVSFQHTW